MSMSWKLVQRVTVGLVVATSMIALRVPGPGAKPAIRASWAAPPTKTSGTSPSRTPSVATSPVATSPVATSPISSSAGAATPPAVPMSRLDASGCSAAACHGGPTNGDLRSSNASFDKALGEDGVPPPHVPPDWRNASTTWSLIDPHRRAFAVLYAPRSVEIYDNLSRMSARTESEALPTSDPEPVAYARFLADRCIGCHATSQRPDIPSETLAGVTCGSCHPSKSAAWTEGHYLATWKPESAVDATTAVSRGELCSSCHLGPKRVGDRVFDVNHDLIAAGHPRLVFELDSLVANYPRHWDERAVAAKRFAATGARFQHLDQWLAGQVAAARRTLDQVEQRAALSGDTADFAQFACGDCHHALSPPTGARPTAARAAARRGQPRPSLDAVETLLSLASHETTTGSTRGAADVEAFANLRRHLERFASPNEISRTAIQQLRQSIDEVAKRGPTTSADRLAFTRWLASQFRDVRLAESWDTTVERLLAADSLVADSLAGDLAGPLVPGPLDPGTLVPGTPVAGFVEALERLRSALSDHTSFAMSETAAGAADAPTRTAGGPTIMAVGPTLYDTPAAFDPSVIEPLLRAIAERLDDPAFPIPEGSRP